MGKNLGGLLVSDFIRLANGMGHPCPLIVPPPGFSLAQKIVCTINNMLIQRAFWMFCHSRLQKRENATSSLLRKYAQRLLCLRPLQEVVYGVYGGLAQKMQRCFLITKRNHMSSSCFETRRRTRRRRTRRRARRSAPLSLRMLPHRVGPQVPYMRT